jgi:hypothetical protein
MWRGLLSNSIDITGTVDPRGKLNTAFPATVRLLPVNNIASALVLNSSWNDPATIAELRRCLMGDVQKSVTFLQDEIKKLMRSAVMGFQAFKEAVWRFLVMIQDSWHGIRRSWWPWSRIKS